MTSTTIVRLPIGNDLTVRFECPDDGDGEWERAFIVTEKGEEVDLTSLIMDLVQTSERELNAKVKEGFLDDLREFNERIEDSARDYDWLRY